MSFWQFLGYWFSLSLIPYGMYLVSFIFKGQKPGYGLNKIPVWKGQSKAFFPGDLGLTLFLTVGFYLFSNIENTIIVNFQWLVFGGLVLAIIATIIGRRVLYKENSCTKKEWNSLTKRYHDAVMYAMFPFLVVLWCVPGYCFVFSSSKWQILAVGFIGLSVWIAGIVWDVVSKEVPNKFQHQTTGKPIWQR